MKFQYRTWGTSWRGKLAVLTVFFGTFLIIGLILLDSDLFWDLVLWSFMFGLLMANQTSLVRGDSWRASE
jgi:hypothetical protein